MNYKSSIYNIESFTDENNRTLLFNSVSGAIAWIDSDTMSLLRNTEIMSDEFDEKVKLLATKGFVVKENFDEWGRLLYDRQMFIFNPNPMVLGFVIAPSLKCNLQCSYCFERDGRDFETMTDEIVDKTASYILDSIKELKSVKEVYISWFGGEPCMQIEKIQKIYTLIYQEVYSMGIKYESRIVTNGLLLNAAVAKKLKENCGVIDAQITIDGLRENYALRKGCTVDDFEILIKNIVDVADILNINLRINVDYDNMKDVPALLKILLDDNKLNGKINIYFAQIQNWNALDKSRAYLEEKEYLYFLTDIHNQILKNNWERSFVPKRPVRQVGPCGSMRCNNTTIGPDGLLYRCEHCIGDSRWAIGSVNEGKYYNNADLAYLLMMPLRECRECKAFPICAGGCLANRILHEVPPLNCKNYVDLLKEQVRFATLAKKR